MVQTACVLLLLGFMVFISFKDVGDLFGVGKTWENWHLRHMFTQGLAYAKRWEAFEAGQGPKPKRDMRLELFRDLSAKRTQVSTHTQVAQVVCLDCDKIFEISAPFMAWYGSTVSSKIGLTPVSQRLQVSAHCDAFRLTATCPRRG